jgi:hypothetical protein
MKKDSQLYYQRDYDFDCEIDNSEGEALYQSAECP